MRMDITVVIIYGTCIKTIYRHTPDEYIVIIHDNTFLKNVNVQFYGILCCLCHLM
jgi:hypothetical protein